MKEIIKMKIIAYGSFLTVGFFIGLLVAKGCIHYQVKDYLEKRKKIQEEREIENGKIEVLPDDKECSLEQHTQPEQIRVMPLENRPIDSYPYSPSDRYGDIAKPKDTNLVDFLGMPFYMGSIWYTQPPFKRIVWTEGTEERNPEQGRVEEEINKILLRSMGTYGPPGSIHETRDYPSTGEGKKDRKKWRIGPLRIILKWRSERK